MKRKLIYISNIRLTESVLDDYYIDYNLGKGAEIEYWDVVALHRNEYDERGTLNVNYLKYIKTYEVLDDFLSRAENQDAIFVMLLAYNFSNIKLFRILSSKNSKMVYIFSGIMPTGKLVPKYQRLIHNFFVNPFEFLKNTSDFLLLKFYEKFEIINPFELEFVTGDIGILKNSHSKKVVPINFFDYDNYKQLEFSKDVIVDYKFILFIDHNAPYHSDSLVLVDDEKYFKSINRVLGLIEEAQNLKIVIAANPKSKYGSEKYEGREFYRLMTPELTREAECVIIPYASSAVSYAVLSAKSILFIYNDELMRTSAFSVNEQVNIAQYLNLKVYNSDLITHGNQLIFRRPSEERCDAYKYSFLTSHESENKSSAQIFWDGVSKL